MRIIRILTVFGIGVAFMLGAMWCKSGKSETQDIQAGQSDFGENGFEISLAQKWQTQAQFAGIYMAMEKGIYAQHGLSVHLKESKPSGEVLEDMAQGKVDIGNLDLLYAMSVNHDEVEIVNIGQVSQKNSILLVAKKKRGINSIRDFEGRKLGIWRTASHLVTESFLEQNGIKMELVPIDFSISTFLYDAVDVINMMRYNEYFQLLQAGMKDEDLFVVDLHERGFGIPDEGFYVRLDFYEAHQDECRAFVRATMDGWLYAFSHPEETVDLILDKMQEAKIRANRAHQSWMLDKMKDVVMPSANEMGILKREDYEKALKICNQFAENLCEISYEEFYPDADR